MQKLTVGNTRKEFETRAVCVIKKQHGEFKFVDIYNAMIEQCENEVAKDFIYGIMCEALEFCLSSRYVEFIDIDKYSVVLQNQDVCENSQEITESV